jgi:hypothetical protein
MEIKMSTEVLGFAEKEMRDEQKRRWVSEGSKGVATYSTHEGNDPKIIWVVTRSEPKVPENSSKKSLTEKSESEKVD